MHVLVMNLRLDPYLRPRERLRQTVVPWVVLLGLPHTRHITLVVVVIVVDVVAIHRVVVISEVQGGVPGPGRGHPAGGEGEVERGPVQPPLGLGGHLAQGGGAGGRGTGHRQGAHGLAAGLVLHQDPLQRAARAVLLHNLEAGHGRPLGGRGTSGSGGSGGGRGRCWGRGTGEGGAVPCSRCREGAGLLAALQRGLQHEAGLQELLQLWRHTCSSPSTGHTGHCGI